MVAFFKENTTTGERRHDICTEAGLTQILKQNDNEYLFDLVLTYIPALLSARVLPKISDHRVVCVDVHVTAPSYAPIQLTVWDMKFSKCEDL